MPQTIYLAGPDVFLPNAREIGERKRALCRQLGFEGLFPLDGEVDAQDPHAIFEANCALMRRADLGVFNLSPFRGPSADAGTAFEVGFLRSLGRPLWGYSNNPAPYKDRVTPDGLMVEDFGLADNLMLDCAIAASGGAIVARASAGLEAMEAFRACLERIAGGESASFRSSSAGPA